MVCHTKQFSEVGFFGRCVMVIFIREMLKMPGYIMITIACRIFPSVQA
jgi:hypothetical protein